ncbi:MAG: hypothetical protein AB8H80_21005 [Planctomycetota bacterium]
MKDALLMKLPLLCLAAGFHVSIAAQTLVTSVGPAANATGVDGAVFFDVSVATVLTLAQIDFETGPATPAGTMASVDIWLTGDAVGARTAPQDLLSWVRVGSTVPAMVPPAGGVATLSAAVVPAPAYTGVTLPMGTFGLALVANGCDLGTLSGFATASTSEMTYSARSSQSSFLNGVPQSGEGFVGSLRYTIGGAPMPLADVMSFGVGCQALELVVTSGLPLRGTTILLTTRAPAAPGLGVCLISDRPQGGTVLPIGIGVDLSFFGAAGCAGFVDPQAAVSLLLNNQTPNGLVVPLAVPNAPSLYGYSLYAQSAWLDGGLFPSGLTTSNGVRIRIG